MWHHIFHVVVVLCNCISEQICFVTNHISIEVLGACGYSALQIIDIKEALLASEIERTNKCIKGK